jgi:hypothetical protein
MNKTRYVVHPHKAQTEKCSIDRIFFRGHKWSLEQENISIEIVSGETSGNYEWRKSSYLTMTSSEASALAHALLRTVNMAELIDKDDILNFSQAV